MASDHEVTHVKSIQTKLDKNKSLSERKKEYWKHFIESRVLWGHGVTKRRLTLVKPYVFIDTAFWQDILGRHRGKDFSPQELKIADALVYKHCMGNFSAMVCQIMRDRKIIKL